MLDQSFAGRRKVASVFGTRPEAIKMLPVMRELGSRPHLFTTCNIITSQHTDLLDPLLEYFGVAPDYRLGVLREGQSLDQLLARLLVKLDEILDQIRPDILLVQGDTTSALAGALSAHHRQIPTVHIEAGLRSGNRYSPFPEELNRRLITQLASYHMAATSLNVENLLREAVPEESIVLTGNPVVDALLWVRGSTKPSQSMRNLLASVEGRKLVVLTSHRRESFGPMMRGNLAALGDFISRHDDLVLVFPVHPNPSVRAEALYTLKATERVKLLDPLLYPDFLHLLSAAWLIVSDSGGIQEEAPTLGKALLVLRENTERPEVIACGCGRLVGGDPLKLARILEEVYHDDAWLRHVAQMDNPFGRGDAAPRIVDALANILHGSTVQSSLE
jgi:UDP-N-acetylglucosamine 2-epimerase (non-hydrolysing)